MSHFARIGLNNIVEQVVYLDTSLSSTEGGIERDDIGIDYLKKHHGEGVTWLRCSYNTHQGSHTDGGTPFRKNYPGVNWIYDSTNDMFYPPRPVDKDGDTMNSHTLNTTTGMWDPPITRPTRTSDHVAAGEEWFWDESVWVGDNTKGWVLLTGLA